MLFLLEKGMSYSQIGILYAVKELSLNLFEIPSGIIADAWGRKYTLASSFLVFIISYVIFYFSESFALFLVAFVFFGIADAFRTGIHKAMMTDYLEINGWISYRTMYYGNTRAWSQRGLAVSSLLGGVIIFLAGSYRSIFLYSIVPYLMSFALLLSYPNVLNRALKVGKHQRWSHVGETLLHFWTIVKQPNVFAVLTNSAAFTAYQRSLKDYLQPIMVSAMALIPVLTNIADKQKNGLLLGGVYFFIYLLTSQASKLSGRVGEKKLRKASLLSFVVGLFAGIFVGIFYQYEYWWLSIVLFTVVFIVENFRKPTVTSLVSAAVPTSVLASVLSAQSQLRTVIAALISLALGFIADSFGIGVAIVCVSVLIMLFFLAIQLTNLSKKN
ncbi:MAG: MFS transporter [Prolixibacteraceae bacterium]|nr:MFS transporter [Prolixibacteraceae bacterium]